MLRLTYFALVISVLQLYICHAKHVVPVDAPGKLDEVDTRPFNMMPGPFMAAKNEDTPLEDETDDVEYSSMETGGHPEGSGSSDGVLEQAMRDMMKHANEQQDSPVQQPIDDLENGGPIFEYKPIMGVPSDSSDDSSEADDRLRSMIEQARILRLLNAMRMMQEQNNGGGGIGPAMMPQQPGNSIGDLAADGQLMSLLRPNGFDGPMRPVDPQDVMMDSAQGGPMDDPAPAQEGTGGVAIVFVPVWRIIERTVFFVSKQPSDQVGNEVVIDNGPADFLFGLLMGLLGVTLTFFLTITALRLVRGRSKRAVSNNKTPLFSPPAYVQPHLTSLPTTKLDGANPPEKPPLDANKV